MPPWYCPVHPVNTRNDKNKAMIPETLFFIACPAFFPSSLPPSYQVLLSVYTSATLRVNLVSGTPCLTLLLSFLAGLSAASKVVVRHQQVGLGTG